MKRPRALVSSFVVISGLVLLCSGAISQPQTLKDRLVGSWAFKSASLERPDGARISLFGADATGIIIFAKDGHFIAIRSTRPNLIVRSAFLAGQLAYAYFGTYTVNEADMTMERRYDQSLVTTDLQGDYRSTLELASDELKLIDRDPTDGKTEFVYRRGK
jgi:hypothetical protein